MHGRAARQLRTVLGFDRVMVYRFDEDGSGEVVGESAAPHLEPYRGLRYPASDIPKQARALYCRNWLRLIADVNAPPVPLLSELENLSASRMRIPFGSTAGYRAGHG